MKNEKETNNGGQGTVLARLSGLGKRKSEMKKCFTDDQGRSRLVEDKSQAVRNVLHTHNYLVFFSPLSELQPASASIKFPWFLLDLQDTESQLSIEAGGYAARKADASAASKSSILQTPAQVARKAKSFSNKAAAVHSAQKDPSSTL